jgi:hypothetical protein
MEVGVLALSSSACTDAVTSSVSSVGDSNMEGRRRGRASLGAYANSVSRSMEAMRGVARDLRAERRTGVTTCKVQQHYMCADASTVFAVFKRSKETTAKTCSMVMTQVQVSREEVWKMSSKQG